MFKYIKFKNSLYNTLFLKYKKPIKTFEEKYPNKSEEYILRVNNALNKYLPFIKSLKKRKFENTLEIGSGFGTVSIGLSFLTKKLTCLEIDNKSVNFLSRSSGMEKTEYVKNNSANFYRKNSFFDLIIYSASLEHMTPKERELSLSNSWKMLKKNGFLIILECPNLYWYKDEHSTKLLFNSWQREDIAFRQTKDTPRKAFMDLYTDVTDKKQVFHWLRRGRPVSKEEIEIYLGIKLGSHNIYSLEKFLGWRFLLRRFTYGLKYNLFSYLLKSLELEDGFCHPFFNIAIKKIK